MPPHDPGDAGRDGGRAAVPIAVTRDGELASGWAEALRASGIEAEVEIGDAQTLVPGSTLSVAGGPVDAMFGYVVLVPAAERARATHRLAELGGPGSGGSGAQPERGVLLRGALVALGAGAVIVAAAVWRLAGLP